ELKKFLDNAISIIKPANPPALMGTVFIPTPGLARTLYAGGVPGCIMPRRLLKTIEKEASAPDHGLEARLERGAKLIAILKGIGYDGVHLSGPQLQYEHIARLLERSSELSPYWESLIGEFIFPEEWRYWYFKKDPVTGLNLTESDDSARRSKSSIKEALPFWFGNNIHRLAFERDGRLFGPLKLFAEYIDKRPALRDGLTCFEHIIKSASYDCRDCGDCTLEETAFICPQSQCAKFLFNGPCGGSLDGWCEIWPEKKRCIYVRGYERVSRTKSRIYKNNVNIKIIGPRNWSLYKTSSWLNFYLGRDHQCLKDMRDPKQNY
ncbi:MAG: methylenetetrahydrofolate reductase C-terminal domain-containing protein, partial [Desulfobacteraceae bacterium]|nr:methylenetetrahydrofolate reductase C-terminal domain-containing protein [Desulfobacteraceae bacterium]